MHVYLFVAFDVQFWRGNCATKDENIKDTIKAIKENKLVPIAPHFSKDLQDLITKMLCSDRK